MIKRIAVFAAIGVLAGCAGPRANNGPPLGPTPGGSGPSTQQPPANGPSAPATPGQKTAAPPRTAAQASSPAVMSLLDTADTLAQAGRMERSAATLERALDLAPRNPFVYQRLAAVRLAQGQTDQAEALASKSNSVAGDNPFVKASNWRLIAEARRSDGDDHGAQAASARAVNYHKASSQYGP